MLAICKRGGGNTLFLWFQGGGKMKKGFATSAILYTMLLLFIILLVSILNNLQNKKTILDTLKKGTISALQQDTIMDSILDQITIINNKIVEFNTKIANYEANTYTKSEIDNMNAMLLTQTNAIQNQLNSLLHPITAIKNTTMDDTYGYTGVDVTIPMNSYFCITARTHGIHAEPIYISINQSKTGNGIDSLVVGDGAGNSFLASTTFCSFTTTEASPFYIWAQYAEAVVDSKVTVHGFYITQAQ